MADTKRTLATLYTLLGNNTTGAISAQDMRDVAKTLAPDFGEISITSSAATTISDSVSFFQAAGTYALSAGALDWDMSVSGRLRYTGPADRIVQASASLVFTSPSNNQVLHLAISKNGAAIVPSTVYHKVGTGSDVGAVGVRALISMATNDYLSLVVKNTSSTANVTFEAANLFSVGFAK